MRKEYVGQKCWPDMCRHQWTSSTEEVDAENDDRLVNDGRFLRPILRGLLLRNDKRRPTPLAALAEVSGVAGDGREVANVTCKA